MGNSQAVQWLGLRAFNAMAPDSIPGQGTKILQALQCSQNNNNNNNNNHPTILIQVIHRYTLKIAAQPK